MKLPSTIFKAVEELPPGFQVLLTDHADLRSDVAFHAAIVEIGEVPAKH